MLSIIHSSLATVASKNLRGIENNMAWAGLPVSGKLCRACKILFPHPEYTSLYKGSLLSLVKGWTGTVKANFLSFFRTEVLVTQVSVSTPSLVYTHGGKEGMVVSTPLCLSPRGTVYQTREPGGSELRNSFNQFPGLNTILSEWRIKAFLIL